MGLPQRATRQLQNFTRVARTAAKRKRGSLCLLSGFRRPAALLAAETVASKLNNSLLRIDLSRVISNYIGETEKNLNMVFSRAGGRGAILFFDEGDALFGRRTDVKDSHDRYSNVEVDYLLERLQSQGWPVILRTKRKIRLDHPCLARIAYMIRQ